MDLTPRLPCVLLPRMAEGVLDTVPDVPVFEERAAPLTKAEVYLAIDAARGNLTEAAKACGVRRSRLKALADSTPEIQVLLDDLRQGHVDKAESNIFADLDRGDQTASRLVAQTLGKDRGWAQSVAGMGKDGAITIEIVKFAEETPGG